jgi:nicotinamidase/pyrazinamidase
MNTIFFDVDTQNDFMNPSGALYVPDAESLKPILAELTQFALKNNILIHGSVDSHSEEDAEFIPNGGPFPLHCLSGSEGQKKIPETLTGKETYIGSSIPGGLVAEDWGWTCGGMGTGDHLIFEKQTYDVMTNRSLVMAKKSLERHGMDDSHITAIVYGVATDYCVKAAALGLRSFGMKVYVVKDAIKEITAEGRKEAFAEFERAGIELVTSKWVFDNCRKTLT